ncbi:MAG: hypothetical protein IT210_17220 [Armatimonadetes bacterium]|nr:hypothetical protein [Armatimonadota bacterium]
MTKSDARQHEPGNRSPAYRARPVFPEGFAGYQDAAGIPECCALVSEVYRFLGASDRFDWLMTNTGHAHFEADRTYSWLVRWLSPPPKPRPGFVLFTGSGWQSNIL